jgi:hypothetical protein
MLSASIPPKVVLPTTPPLRATIGDLATRVNAARGPVEEMDDWCDVAYVVRASPRKSRDITSVSIQITGAKTGRRKGRKEARASGESADAESRLCGSLGRGRACVAKMMCCRMP